MGDYEDKRDFTRTPEPGSGDRPDFGQGDRPFFVIQQHDASTMHWDFRLEVDGVLKSWAVPKGPSTDPRDKRLAVATEDHPVAYGDFEGVIPEGEYGDGSVVVWDAGPYENLRHGDDGEALPMSECLAQGQVEVRLQGSKLQGGYALIHSRMGGNEDAWLLVKMKDEGADARRRPTSTQPESVLTGRTVDDVAEEARE